LTITNPKPGKNKKTKKQVLANKRGTHLPNAAIGNKNGVIRQY